MSRHRVVTAFIETVFQRLARRPDGISREHAVERGDQAVAGMREGYVEGLRADLARLDHVVELIAGAEHPSAADCREAYRLSGYIRDLGGTFGDHAVTAVADRCCEFLFRMGESGIDARDGLAAHIDALRLVCKAPAGVITAQMVETLVADLTRLAERVPDPDQALRESDRRAAEVRAARAALRVVPAAGASD